MAIYVSSKRDTCVNSIISSKFLDDYPFYQESLTDPERHHRDTISPSIWKSSLPEYQAGPAYEISRSQVLPNESVETETSWNLFLPPRESLLHTGYGSPSNILPPKSHNSSLNCVNEQSIWEKVNSCKSRDDVVTLHCGKYTDTTDRGPEKTLDLGCGQSVKVSYDLRRTLDLDCAIYRRAIHSPCLQLDGLRYERSIVKGCSSISGPDSGGVLTAKLSPYSPLCAVPLPDSLFLEPGFIHRRNERERDRVRSLNEGYDRLKESLPLRNKDKRISKVDTLRFAIRYIRQLRNILSQTELAANRKSVLVTEQESD